MFCQQDGWRRVEGEMVKVMDTTIERARFSEDSFSWYAIRANLYECHLYQRLSISNKRIEELMSVVTDTLDSANSLTSCVSNNFCPDMLHTLHCCHMVINPCIKALHAQQVEQHFQQSIMKVTPCYIKMLLDSCQFTAVDTEEEDHVKTSDGLTSLKHNLICAQHDYIVRSKIDC